MRFEFRPIRVVAAVLALLSFLLLSRSADASVNPGCPAVAWSRPEAPSRGCESASPLATASPRPRSAKSAATLPVAATTTRIAKSAVVRWGSTAAAANQLIRAGVGPNELSGQLAHNGGVRVRRDAQVLLRPARTSMATNSGGDAMAGVRAAGAEGEAAAGIVKNTQRIPSSSGSAAYRIPDELGSGVLGEVKNVSSLSYTSQLKDFMSYARQNGLEFRLYVRGSTTLSGPLQQLVDSGQITLVRNLPG